MLLFIVVQDKVNMSLLHFLCSFFAVEYIQATLVPEMGGVGLGFRV